MDAHIQSPQEDTIHIRCWDYKQTYPCTGETTYPITFTSNYGYCGDGVKNGDEECDGSGIVGTCKDYGFDEGSLSCSNNCKVVTSMCTRLKTESTNKNNAAKDMLTSANLKINSANKRITEASDLGADVSSATQYIRQAESDYSSADTLLSNGDSSFASNDYTTANSYYDQSLNKASTAQTSAANAESMIDKIIEAYNKEKTEAQNEVSDANSAIDTAKQRIDDADKVIEDATIIGLDSAQAKADVATARSKIKTADDYYSEASNMFSANNYESSKSKSQSAIILADEAEILATKAYNSLQERLTVAGESSKAILNANSEISQMNEILTKMDYIVISTEKWGVDLTETKSVVSTAKLNVDSAEDMLSTAKNRQSSGSFDIAVNSANEARDNAASSKNRLDTMTQGISISTQDALEKAYTNLELKLKEAEAEVQSALSTYGATPELIINSQNELSEAKKSLQQAKNDIGEVETAAGLMSLLEKTEIAFNSIDLTEQKITNSIENATNAKMGLTKKVAIGATVVAGTIGGGFLYYRKRKNNKGKEKQPKKKEKSDEKKNEKIEPKKKEEKKIDKCPKCEHKIEKEKFCPECGEKIK